MRRIFTLLLLIVTGMMANGQANHLVISQVYGGGGNASATYNQDFIEIFNPHTASISTSGYSVQYASSTGTTWQKVDLTAVTLDPGQYYLVRLATGATGAALPAGDATGSINMSGSNGKVALVNSTVALSGTQCPTMDASIVDYIGFGTANCYESAAAPGTSNNTMSIQRISNGCTDGNNNSSDFAIAAVNPRNTLSTLNPCGAPGSALSAAPSSLTLTSFVNIASESEVYVLSGTLLNGSDIVVTAGAGLEISLDNVSFTNTFNLSYTGGTLLATTIYVRTTVSAPQGALVSSVTNVGGGASLTVNVSGSISRNYYSKSSGTLESLSTWGTNTDGSGSSPSDFSTPYQIFNIVNQPNATIAGAWDVSGAGSKIVIGNGVTPVNFTIPSMFEVSSTSRVDVSSNSTMTLENNIRPFLGSLETNSTVDFAQSGTSTTDTIKIPAINYYNLTLTGGLKYLSGGTTTVRGDFNAISVVSMNGGSGPFSTMNAFGNVNFLGSTFEDDATGDAGRITLALNSISGSQNLGGFGLARLFRIRRDSVNYNVNINVSSSLNLSLGNSTSGGLQLNQGGATTTTMTTSSSLIEIKGGAFITSSSMGRINANGTNISVTKDMGASSPGILRATPGSIFNDLTLALGPAVTRDSLTIDENVIINGMITLTNGKLVIDAGKMLDITSSSTFSGGSISSFIDGKIRIPVSTGTFLPIGKGVKYAPLEFPNVIGSFLPEIQYFNSGFGDTDIDPSTLALYPNYTVSTSEYWMINSTDAITADIIFYYNDAAMGNGSQLRIAHHDNTDWNDLGGTSGGANTAVSGNVQVTGVTDFGPFTFAATSAGVLPVRLKDFMAQKYGTSVKLSWITEQEINTSHFVIEKSINGRNWSEVTTVTAAGNSNSERIYSALDLNPAKGINYYRLRIVDLDSRFEFSGIRAISISSSSAITIAPNPASDELRVSLLTYLNNEVKMMLVDQSGKVVRTIISNNEALVNIKVADLASGVYYLKIYDGDQVTTHQFIKK